MSDLPKEIWVVPSYTGTDTGTYDALGEGDYNATKYTRADLASQKQTETTDKEACVSNGGSKALEVFALGATGFFEGTVNAELYFTYRFTKNQIQTIRAALASQQQPEMIDKEVCFSENVNNEFEALGRALKPVMTTKEEYVEVSRIIKKLKKDNEETIRAALERKQEPVDVEGIKKPIHHDDRVDIGTRDTIRNLNIEAYIYNQAIDDLNDQGYFTQSAEKDAAIRDLAAALTAIKWLWDIDCEDHPDEDSVGWNGDGNIPVTFGDIRKCIKTLKTHAAAIEAAEKGGA